MSNDQLSESVAGVLSSPKRTPILLIDDDAEQRRQLQLFLLGYDYDVRAYADAEALLRDTRSRPVTCLVSDMHTLGCDGITVLRRLRADGWKGQALLITASREADVARRALQEGFYSVLFRPLTDRVILESVKKAVHSTIDQREDLP